MHVWTILAVIVLVIAGAVLLTTAITMLAPYLALGVIIYVAIKLLLRKSEPPE